MMISFRWCSPSIGSLDNGLGRGKELIVELFVEERTHSLHLLCARRLAFLNNLNQILLVRCVDHDKQQNGCNDYEKCPPHFTALLKVWLLTLHSASNLFYSLRQESSAPTVAALSVA